MILQYALNIKRIKKKTRKKIKLPKKRKTVEDIESESIRDKFLGKDELEKFLLTAKTNGLDSDLLMFTTLAYTGLRTSELLTLQWSDIDFEARPLQETKSMSLLKYININNQ